MNNDFSYRAYQRGPTEAGTDRRRTRRERLSVHFSTLRKGTRRPRPAADAGHFPRRAERIPASAGASRKAPPWRKAHEDLIRPRLQALSHGDCNAFPGFIAFPPQRDRPVKHSPPWTEALGRWRQTSVKETLSIIHFSVFSFQYSFYIVPQTRSLRGPKRQTVGVKYR